MLSRIKGAENMKKERNTAIVLLLTLILITLVILCVLIATGRLDTVGQSEEEKQTTVMEELEKEDFTTEDSTHSSKETVDDFSNPEDAQNSESEVFSLQEKNVTNLSVTALKQEDMEYAQYISQLTWLLTSDDWVPSEITPTDYVMWYGYHVKTSGSVEAYRREGEDGLFFPQEEFEQEVQKYFDVSTEHLRSDAEIYLADRKVYRTPVALYILSKKECTIKKVTDEDEKIEILFSLFYPESGNCSEIVLSIKKENDGFSYLSYVHK